MYSFYLDHNFPQAVQSIHSSLPDTIKNEIGKPAFRFGQKRVCVDESDLITLEASVDEATKKAILM
jgi:hypothetical protein